MLLLHRLHPGLTQQRYWLTTAQTASAMQAEFRRLSAEQPINSVPITLGYRQINVQQQAGEQIHLRYADLCEQPLSAIDFISLCDPFSRIFLSAVPNLSAQQRAPYIARGTEDGAPVIGNWPSCRCMTIAHGALLPWSINAATVGCRCT
jgi:cell division protein ZapE